MTTVYYDTDTINILFHSTIIVEHQKNTEKGQGRLKDRGLQEDQGHIHQSIEGRNSILQSVDLLIIIGIIIGKGALISIEEGGLITIEEGGQITIEEGGEEIEDTMCHMEGKKISEILYLLN